MKIIHTSDLHLGQVIYRHYDRDYEHYFFFRLLIEVCEEERPDSLLVTGDIFDIQQPSAATWRRFTDHFIAIHHALPGMPVIMIAGNHDSPSRLHSHKPVWAEIGTSIIALPPAPGDSGNASDWADDYIIELESGFIVALPFMTSLREDCVKSLLDEVSRRNAGLGKPVVMTGHLAISGCDITGHDIEIGRMRTIDLPKLGQGYDYLALGHIHRPLTLGGAPDNGDMESGIVYETPVARYSGSALHVSCDERYPHSISIVTIARHGGPLELRTRRIEQLRHFHILPMKDEPEFGSAEDALDRLRMFVAEGGEGYFRFRMPIRLSLPPDFQQRIFDIIGPLNGRLRYNPKIDWIGTDDRATEAEHAQVFEVAELQQMTDPLRFIEKTIEQYPGLDFDRLRKAFGEIEEEIRKMDEEPQPRKDKRKL